ncbi:16S rRNA (uracil(1498)-N(3))-methyltransferase [Limnobacter sp.]|jgi:16S rRNA (uracil1498-N3)-methyltransferase|uniref:16S rRNA (uracil(1498)-N(3))-methyltransferase n=1 Tax=Limnobacter sp. TaxID=2003368 RepID=UPI00374989E8
MKHDQGKRLPRFLLEHCNSVGQVLDLSDDLMHYASRVLRLREGEALRVWNGKGCEYNATVHYVSKKLAQIHVGEKLAVRNTELNRQVHVFQALPEGDKMDWVLEKCTELGVAGFQPVQAQRSVVKLEGERAAKRQAHWERVVLAASLQSEREQLPFVEPVRSLSAALEYAAQSWPNAQVLWFTPQAEESLKNWCLDAKTGEPLIVCVGPEGGWSPEETNTARQLGALPLNFSRRVLRTETFAVACTAQLTALLNLEAN